MKVPRARMPPHRYGADGAHAAPEIQVKAAGGIRTADQFLDMVHAGATRIGCSAGVAIIEELGRRFEAEGISSVEL